MNYLTSQLRNAIVSNMTKEQLEMYRENLLAVMWFIAMNWMAVLSVLFVVLIHLEVFK